PTAFYGSYAEHFLNLPSDVLITSMKEHKRYFTVVNEELELLPYYDSVRNGDDQAIENVAQGNEKVLRDRLSDGEIYNAEDKKISRAAEISKFDLMTDMVNEFPELQGVMGEKYALILGEDEEVAEAVKEHYLPVQAKDKLPKSQISTVVSIADKLDTVISSISVGLMPTGSQDPYSLRRQAIGVLRIMEEKAWDIRVEELLAIVENVYNINDEKLKEE